MMFSATKAIYIFLCYKHWNPLLASIGRLKRSLTHGSGVVAAILTLGREFYAVFDHMWLGYLQMTENKELPDT